MKALQFLALIFTAALLCGCGGNDIPDTSTATEASPPSKEVVLSDLKTVELDLSSAGLPLTIKVPEGSTAQRKDNRVFVERGDAFGLIIEEGTKDIQKWKIHLQETYSKPVNRLVDKPDAYYYEFVDADTGAKSYFFIINVTAGDKEYHVSNIDSHENSRKKRKNVDVIYRSAQSLSAK